MYLIRLELNLYFKPSTLLFFFVSKKSINKPHQFHTSLNLNPTHFCTNTRYPYIWSPFEGSPKYNNHPTSFYFFLFTIHQLAILMLLFLSTIIQHNYTLSNSHRFIYTISTASNRWNGITVPTFNFERCLHSSLSNHCMVIRQSWTGIKSTIVTFLFFLITLRNFLAPPLLLYICYSGRERREFDEPRSRPNQCIEPEAKQLFVWSPQGGQAIVDRDQIDTRHFFLFVYSKSEDTLKSVSVSVRPAGR